MLFSRCLSFSLSSSGEDKERFTSMQLLVPYARVFGSCAKACCAIVSFLQEYGTTCLSRENHQSGITRRLILRSPAFTSRAGCRTR